MNKHLLGVIKLHQQTSELLLYQERGTTLTCSAPCRHEASSCLSSVRRSTNPVLLFPSYSDEPHTERQKYQIQRAQRPAADLRSAYQRPSRKVMLCSLRLLKLNFWTPSQPVTNVGVPKFSTPINRRGRTERGSGETDYSRPPGDLTRTDSASAALLGRSDVVKP